LRPKENKSDQNACKRRNANGGLTAQRLTFVRLCFDVAVRYPVRTCVRSFGNALRDERDVKAVKIHLRKATHHRIGEVVRCASSCLERKRFSARNPTCGRNNGICSRRVGCAQTESRRIERRIRHLTLRKET